MNHTSLNIAIPESAWAFVDKEVTRGGFGGREEFIARLIEEAQEKKEQLRQAVAVGIEQLEKGEYSEYTDKTLPELGQEIEARGGKLLAEPRKKR